MPAAPLNTEGQPSFDICQRGSWEFLWYSHPSERNHWNHHLLWNSFAPLTPDATNQSTSHPEDYWLVYSVCVSERAQMLVWSYEYMHIWFSVWPCMLPGWSRRLGYVAYCISSWGGSWGCCAEAHRRRAWFTVCRRPAVTGSVFWKTSSQPRRETTTSPTLFDSPSPPKSPNLNH